MEASTAGRVLAGLTLAAACSSSPETGDNAPNQGGSHSGGATTSSGGAGDSGGASSSGGTTASGGAAGDTSSGGDPSTMGGASGGDTSSGGASGGDSSGGTSSGGDPSTGGIGGGAAGEVGSGGQSPGKTLPPFNAKSLTCFGEDYGQDASGYIGRCCYMAHCYEPAGNQACMPARDIENSGIVPYPPGSGECSCYDAQHPVVVGPYGPNPTSPMIGSGRCCYLVGVIGCEGRPLRVDGDAIVAGTVRRNDWAFLRG